MGLTVRLGSADSMPQLPLEAIELGLVCAKSHHFDIALYVPAMSLTRVGSIKCHDGILNCSRSFGGESKALDSYFEAFITRLCLTVMR